MQILLFKNVIIITFVMQIQVYFAFIYWLYSIKFVVNIILHNIWHLYILYFLSFAVCLGCNKPGVYGITCDTQCPSNCKYSTCHIELGNCFACKPGWTGKLCYRSKITYWNVFKFILIVVYILQVWRT